MAARCAVCCLILSAIISTAHNEGQYLGSEASVPLDETCLLQKVSSISTRHMEQHREDFATTAKLPGMQKCRRSPDVVVHEVAREALMSDSLHLDEPRRPTPFKFELHENRTAELRRRSSQPLDLIFYGDSITEMWRGHCVGMPCGKADLDTGFIQNVTGVPEIFHKSFVERFGPSEVMAVGGDTPADLLWRLQHGEAPIHQLRAAVLQIGINDINELGAICEVNKGYLVTHTCHGPLATDAELMLEKDAQMISENVYLAIKATIVELLKSCNTPVLLTALFPTGYKWPLGPYGKIVPRVNNLLFELASQSKNALHVIDCSRAVLNDATGKIDPALMPDFLHPSPKGMARWADCISLQLTAWADD